MMWWILGGLLLTSSLLLWAFCATAARIDRLIDGALDDPRDWRRP